jgi:predicted nucleic-acid-binding protein
MLAIDSNVLVRLVVRDDDKQLAPAEQHIAKGAWVSHLVLAETVWVLDAVYERTSEQIAAAIDRLLHHQALSVQDSETVTAALEHYRKRPKLGFSDCLVLEAARKAGHTPLGTFDRHLAKLEGSRLLT